MSDVGARYCYICLETDPLDDVTQWVSPCRCDGSPAWVHEACLLRWTEDNESSGSTAAAACPRCHKYVIAPNMGPVVTVIHVFANKIYPHIQQIVYVNLCSMGFYVVFISIGIFALSQVYGVAEAMDMTSGDMAVVPHLTGYGVLLVNCFPWEDLLLAALRRASRLPVLGCVLPSEPPPEYVDHHCMTSWSRILVGCVALPVMAKVVGNIFFKSEESNLRRVLVGGAAYLAVKCGLYMYYRQKLQMRWKEMKNVNVI